MRSTLHLWLFLGWGLFTLSCGKKDTTTTANSNRQNGDHASGTTRKDETDTSSVLGYYVGYFNGIGVDYDIEEGYQDNKITISVDTITGNKIKGHSVVAGVYSPFEGNVEVKTAVYKTTRWVVTNAIGYKRVYNKDEHIHTGKLSFIMDSITSTCQGTWKFLNKNSPLYEFNTFSDYFEGEVSSRYYNGPMTKEGGWKDKKEHIMHLGGLKQNGDKMSGRIWFNDRNLEFEGNLKKVEIEVTVKQYVITEAKEYGDSPYNGVFTFNVDPGTDILSGTWIPNDTNTVSVKSCKYSLRKRSFEYAPDKELDELVSSYIYDPEDPHRKDDEFEILTDANTFNASTTLLKDEDISNFHAADLEVMRNAIYARHGYSFQNKRMRYLFDGLSWYVPVSVDVRDQLTEIEEKNIELIMRYEEHAEKYYDSFGR
jgi:hypothetical protein